MRQTAKRTKKVSLKQTAFTRFMLVIAVFVVWIGGISIRLVHLQVQQAEWLKEQAQGVRTDHKSSKMLRGTIFDRNGRTLAISVRVKTLYADATKLADPKATARAVAKALNINETKLAQQLADGKENERRFVPIAKGLDEESVQRVNRLLEDPKISKADAPKYHGLHWREDQKRSYPHETLAAHVIGFSNAEGNGQAGIEQSKNDELFGSVIRKVQERDRKGRVYDETVTEKEPAKDISLTLSVPIQFATDQALERRVKESGSRAGMAVVIDNRTGEILALSNYPTFNPNNLNEIRPDNLANGAIQGIYSPGSVFKLVTYGSALDRGLITPDGMIDSGNGTIEIAKHKFTDSHAIGRVSYTKALAHSSNVCAIKTSMRVGKESFYEYIQKFGFGKSTGVELPAETGGIVRAPERWNGDSLASMSIGYEIGVSALQIATAFATIANDGVRIQPHLIKEIRQSDEKVLPLPVPGRTQVVSTETARSLRKMLREVVVAGTGKRAQLDGYTSAGKTGTAWKFDPAIKAINRAKYVSSFVGFAPADDPAVTIAIVMDEPKLGGRDGGGAAAPAFREIAQSVLAEMKIEMDLDASSTMAETEEDIPETPGVEDAAVADDAPAGSGPREDGQDRPDATTPRSRIEVKPSEKPAAGNPKSKPDPTPKRGDADRPPENKKSQQKNKLAIARVEFKT
ncbi:MAG TPA: penicillin-binding transpeptidase domain-containing protein [Pyrinomonadaceae bacterium]|nr:penicillin-binding transpeptidase domain-containing protein [Pyrinomonadaceae bacterium]